MEVSLPTERYGRTISHPRPPPVQQKRRKFQPPRQTQHLLGRTPFRPRQTLHPRTRPAQKPCASLPDRQDQLSNPEAKHAPTDCIGAPCDTNVVKVSVTLFTQQAKGTFPHTNGASHDTNVATPAVTLINWQANAAFPHTSGTSPDTNVTPPDTNAPNSRRKRGLADPSVAPSARRGLSSTRTGPHLTSSWLRTTGSFHPVRPSGRPRGFTLRLPASLLRP